MKKSNVLLYVSLFFLLSCATPTPTPTPYQKSAFGGGWTETKLAENIFQVNFRGNGFTSSERVSDFVILRCAELTLKNGYKYFAILDKQDVIKHSVVTTPVYAYTAGSLTTFMGGNVINIEKPKSHRTIVMLHTLNEKPEQKSLVLDADFLEKTLRSKYNLVKEGAVPETGKR